MNRMRTTCCFCGFFLLIVIVLSSPGCYKADPTENMFPLGGTWSGTANEMRWISDQNYHTISIFQQPTVTIKIIQNDKALSGTWSITYSNPAYNGAGTLTGSAWVEKDGYTAVDGSYVQTGWRTFIDAALTSTTSGYPNLSTNTWIIIKEFPNSVYITYKGGSQSQACGYIQGHVTLSKQ